MTFDDKDSYRKTVETHLDFAAISDPDSNQRVEISSSTLSQESVSENTY